MGIDFSSTTLWMEYIDFLHQENPQGAYAENLKVQTLRKVYQQAVSSPKMSIEQIWRDYNSFEQNVNKSSAKKVTEAVSKAYFSAKRATYDYENVTRSLVRGTTSVPPQGTIQEIQQLQIWRRYISWEKQNPLRAENHSILVNRVMYAYKQCLLCFAYCPDVWYDAALYLQKASEAMDTPSSPQWGDEATTLYTNAINGPLPNNLLINFAYADFEELRKNNDIVEGIYNKLLSDESIDHTLIYIQYMNFSRRTQGVKGARSVFKKARDDPKCGYHAYVAAALMEYYITKDKSIAFRVFELGMKKFGNDIGFLLAYIDYLSHLNEDNNTRVLFEKAVAAVPLDESSKLWEKFTSFESTVGDIASLLKVERRRSAVLRLQVILILLMSQQPLSSWVPPMKCYQFTYYMLEMLFVVCF
jgi:cleavage stimulation factor subunit 3